MLRVGQKYKKEGYSPNHPIIIVPGTRVIVCLQTLIERRFMFFCYESSSES